MGKKPQTKTGSRTELIAALLCLALLLILGLIVHDDFGLHWDSLSTFSIGEANTNYIRTRDPSFFNFWERYYGPFFEIVLLNLTHGLAEREMFFARHLIIFLYFLLGLIGFYFLLKRIVKQWPLALLGCSMLVISPRIFSDAFYNSKDIPFLVVFILCMLTLHLYLEKPAISRVLLHGFLSGILITTRMPGIVMVAFTFAFMLLEAVIYRNLKWQTAFGHSAIYLASTLICTYLFWPVLWHDPIHELITAFEVMSRYPWPEFVIYRGQAVEATNLPWHYIPVWMSITIPLGTILFSLIGFFQQTAQFLRSKLKRNLFDLRDFLLISAWLFIPVAAVIILKSVLYDGWRQMFFIYPAVIVFAILGVKALLSLRVKKIAPQVVKAFAIGLILFAIVEPLKFMLRYHPLEMVYFNQFVTLRTTNIRHNYDMEYWGLSYRQGLEYVLAANPGKTIKIAVANYPGRLNARLLPPSERDRLVFVSTPEEADYFLTNYRWHPDDYDYPNEVYNIKIWDETIFSAFKMPSSPQP